MIGIYKITNKLNGKVYIGQSIHIKTRWIQHINAKDNVLIHKSIQKYGAENFSFEVLLECPAEMLNDWERDMIALYDCISPNGYNLTEGGENTYQISDEVKLKISNSHKGYKFSEEAKRKMSEARKGKAPWNKGKTNVYSEEALLKMSELKKGKQLSEETRLKMSESRKGHPGYNKGVPMSKEAKIKISEKLKGRTSTTKGKHWKIENGKRIWY